VRRRIEEQVAKRVEEELERRRDEIEAEVRHTLHTLSLPLFLTELSCNSEMKILTNIYFCVV